MNKALTFGVEIETINLDRDQSARAIAAAIPGAYVERVGSYYDKVCVVLADGRRWTCMTDGSITGGRGGRGTEVVSPICTYADLEMVQIVARAMRGAGADVNGSCGVHVHLGASFFDAKAVVRLTKIVAKWQPWIEKALEIQTARLARWCGPTRPGFLAAASAETAPTMDRLNELWYGYRNTAPTHYDPTRYTGLNLHAIWNKGTIEFRWFEATLHAGKIKAYIQFAMALGSSAINSKRAESTGKAYCAETAGFDFYQLLHKLGVSTGEEFKALRHHLLASPPAFKGTTTWSKVKAAKAATRLAA
jgi:hypothetical protein